ncbi:MAG: cyclic nucleotide-binding domain-containing protein [Magnetococcales bacterium]|nr:cyclic nucleotide-binding domain-containing protein [Magnetococcales bacterium]
MEPSFFSIVINPRDAWRRLSSGQRLVAGLFALGFMIGGVPEALTSASANALFIGTYGADSLPYVYLSLAVITPALGALYLRCERALSLSLLLMGTLLVNVAVLGLLWLGWYAGWRWVAFAAAAWVNVEWVLSSLVLWGLANQVLNVRQSKRAFGLIGIGELLALMLGGVSTPFLVDLLGTPGLLLISAASCLGGMWLVSFIFRHLVPHLDGDVAAGPKMERTGIGDGPDRPYILSILALSAFGVVAYHFVDNAFYDSLSLQYPTEDALSSYMGRFNAVVALVGLVYRLFFSNLVFNHFGIKVAILLPPLALLIGGLAVVGFGWWVQSAGWFFVLLTSGNKLFEHLGSEAIHKGVLLTLYQPLPAKRRTGVQVIVESFVEPLAGGVAGLVLLWCNKGLGFTARELTAASLVVVALWLHSAWRLHARYMAALGRALERQRLGGKAFLAEDDASLTLLRQGLFSPRLPYGLYCLQWMDRRYHHRLEEDIPRLLDHPELPMRLEAAGVVERRQMVSVWDAIQRRLSVESDPGVRGRLLRALAAVGEDDAMDMVSPYLRDPSPLVQRETLVAMLKHCGIEGIILAGADLLRAADSDDPERRRMVARVVEEVADRHLYRILLRLLDDPDLSVRWAALDAATKLATVPRLQQAVMVQLLNRETSRKAEAFLVAAGPVVVPGLERILLDEKGPSWVKIRVISILGRMKSPTSGAILDAFLDRAPTHLRHAILQSLRRLDHHVALERRPSYATLLQDEVRSFAEWMATVVDLERIASMRIARDGIRQELGRIQERVFIVVSLLYPLPALRDAWVHYTSGLTGKRSYAIEIIDNILPKSLKGQILSVLDDQPLPEKLRILEPFYPQRRLDVLARLKVVEESPLTPGKPWLHAALMHGSAILGGEAFSQMAATAYLDPHPVVRETVARFALSLPLPEARHTLRTLVADPDQRVSAMARWMRHRLDNPESAVRTVSERVPMSTIEKIIFLKHISLFSSIPEECLADIADRMEEGESLPGEAIVRQGEWGNTLYIVGSGQVRVVINGVSVATMGEGEVFGELALLDPEPRSATVEAVGDVRHYRIDGQGFNEILDMEPSVARNIIRMLCRRLREVRHRETKKRQEG